MTKTKSCEKCGEIFETIYIYRDICHVCQPGKHSAEWIVKYAKCLDCGVSVLDAEGELLMSCVHGRFGDRGFGSMCKPCNVAGDYDAKANAEVRERLLAEGKVGDFIDDYENWRGRQQDSDEYYFCKANDCLTDWR
jgi:hypothetical protein